MQIGLAHIIRNKFLFQGHLFLVHNHRHYEAILFLKKNKTAEKKTNKTYQQKNVFKNKTSTLFI